MVFATNQARLAIPFVVDSSNPSQTKGWSEDHITKTQAWYKGMATWAKGHAEKGPTTKESPISLVEEWDFSKRALARITKAYKVSVAPWVVVWGHVFNPQLHSICISCHPPLHPPTHPPTIPTWHRIMVEASRMMMRHGVPCMRG